jgi:hypothetical protein
VNLKFIATAVTTGAIALSSIPFAAIEANAQQDVQFICSESYDRSSGQRFPTTFAWTQRGKIAVIRWKNPWGNITPKERCEQVSPRFGQAYNNGNLKFITNSSVNGQPVICTTTQYGGSCQTMLMTLRSGDNSFKILNELKDILGGRGTGPVVHSSGAAQAYYQVDMDNFLRTAPVEQK